uniref:Uncharacterized protein n=1 Tax=Anguilla anguilla TaxID=7936 RepID=A0A0E9P5K9_ANGAN
MTPYKHYKQSHRRKWKMTIRLKLLLKYRKILN